MNIVERMFWMIPIALVTAFFLFLCMNRYVGRRIPLKGSLDGVVFGTVVSMIVLIISTYSFFRAESGTAAANIFLLIVLGFLLFTVLIIVAIKADERKYK